jgi:hypothetical protein
MQKLFEIHSKFLSRMVDLACGCLDKAPNQQPNSPDQYLVIKPSAKNHVLEFVFSTSRIAIVVRVDDAADFIKIHETGVFVVKGDVLRSLLKQATAEKMTVGFDSGPAGGNLICSFPNAVEKEEWTFPCIDPTSLDLTVSPKIDLGDERQFKISNINDFSRCLVSVGMAVGKDAGNPTYRNVLVRTKAEGLDIVSSNIGHLAFGKTKYETATGNFHFVTPYEQLLTFAKLLDAELPAVFVHNNGEPGTVVVMQEVKYGSDKPLGRVFLRTSCATEPFVQFDATIKKLEAKLTNQCKADVTQFVGVCQRLALLQPPETKVVWNKEKEALVFSKQEAGRGTTKGIALPVKDMVGKEKFDLVLSSIVLKMIADKATDEETEIEWLFGEPTDFACIRFSTNLKTYFSPFKEMT